MPATALFPASVLISTAASLGLLAAPPAAPTAPKSAGRTFILDQKPWQHDDGTITWNGRTFPNWEAYRAAVPASKWRCGTELAPIDDANGDIPYEGGIAGSTADCTASFTNPAAEYDPSVETYCVQVVVHIIRNSSGSQGNVPVARIQNQIDVLNRDFNALLGEFQTDVRIQFQLATVDPQGNPTEGYTLSNNTTWYNDGGSYWNSLAWDTNRYLNIYTNSAGGALGYVPALPQNGGLVGSNSDRVVCFWQAFGENPAYAPFNLGRTTVHEVGHYLGLYHTFQSCGTASCYSTGDLICDTNRESTPNFGCGTQSTCGDGPDPTDNFMDYSDDPCMVRFTPEQARRMRCTLLNWRPNLYTLCGGGGGGGGGGNDYNADLNNDTKVNGVDLATLLTNWNVAGAVGDIDGDGQINGADLAILLSAWTG